MNIQVKFDAELIRRYDQAGPRYTSYPTAVEFNEQFAENDYRSIACATNSASEKMPLSLYIHIPFCDTVCFYCACNKVVTKDRGKAAPYLTHLYRELQMQGQLFDRDRPLTQLHWGGGTPTFLSHPEMTDLMQHISDAFTLVEDEKAEYSIEIDPREADESTIHLLRQLGFNRLSLGVQDFNPQVQKAVNRIQTQEQTFSIIDAARSAGFYSVSLDLIYGLPFQSVESFETTLETVIAAKPDRLSVFNYAHMPEMFKPQRRINAADLPSPEEKLNILQHTIEQLTQAGYCYIGMDHFARPEDELAIAQRQGTLYRNFQGYSTHSECDLVAVGITSIGKVGDCYAQNVRSLDEYYQRIAANHLAVYRGLQLDQDDVIRRSVITALICNFDLDTRRIEEKYKISFKDYFSVEIGELEKMQEDGLLQWHEQRLQVTAAGRLLIRNICMVFDRYLRERKQRHFSRVI